MQLLATTEADPAVRRRPPTSRPRFSSAGRWAAPSSAGSATSSGAAARSPHVLTYALCTGLCAFAQTWWQLMIFRFIAALGIGGEWAVGARC